MELLATLLLALPTIFLAAFLAATLESFRERLRTRRWVMRNLLALAEQGRFDSGEHFRAAYRRWLDADSPEGMDKSAWQDAWYLSVSTAPDLSPLLRGEAATSVPATVFAALSRFESELTAVKQLEAYLREHFTQQVAPLWYERRAPLTGADRRRVEWFLQLLEAMETHAERAREAFAEFREAITVTA